MRFLCPVFVFASALSVAGIAPAQTGATFWPTEGFVTTLSAPDVAAAGLTKLSADEQSALNNLVAAELSAARAGNVRGFAGTFIGRRTPADRAKAGLDRLAPAEQERLNMLVALALAGGPPAPQFASSLGKDALAVVNRLQIHGEVSLTVGSGSGGRSFYGTSLFTTITDPGTNLTIGFGYEQYKGKGFLGYGYGPYDYYYPDYGFLAPTLDSGYYLRRH